MTAWPNHCRDSISCSLRLSYSQKLHIHCHDNQGSRFSLEYSRLCDVWQCVCAPSPHTSHEGSLHLLLHLVASLRLILQLLLQPLNLRPGEGRVHCAAHSAVSGDDSLLSSCSRGLLAPLQALSLLDPINNKA